MENKKIRVTQTVAIKMDTGGAEPYLDEGDRHARNNDILWENLGKPITDLEAFLITTDAQTAQLTADLQEQLDYIDRIENMKKRKSPLLLTKN